MVGTSPDPIVLAPAILDQEQDLDEDDDTETDREEPQLDLVTDQLNPDDDPMDVATQDLWNRALDRDKFSPRVLEMLRNGSRYHSGIQLAECEDRNGILYFRNRQYVTNQIAFA